MSSESLDHKISKYTYKLKHAKNRNEAEEYQQHLQHYHNLKRGGMRGGQNDAAALDAFKKSYTDLEGNIQKKIEEISKISGLDTSAVEAQLKAISNILFEADMQLETVLPFCILAYLGNSKPLGSVQPSFSKKLMLKPLFMYSPFFKYPFKYLVFPSEDCPIILL